MVLSSDKMSGLRKPMVILKLETKKPGANAPEETLIEMDATELASFISTLKNAQNVRTYAI